MQTVAEIAEQFNVSTRTVLRWIADGCPTVRRGRKGNGGGFVLDADQVKAWRQSRGADSTAATLEAASLVPELLADAVDRVAREIEGPHKAATNTALASAWYLTILRLNAVLRERYPESANLIKDPTIAPDSIWRLLQANRRETSIKKEAGTLTVSNENSWGEDAADY